MAVRRRHGDPRAATSRNGASAGSIIAEWNACDVCSAPARRRRAAPSRFQHAGDARRGRRDTRTAPGALTAASVAARRRAAPSSSSTGQAAPRASPRAAAACISRPRAATSAQRVLEREHAGEARRDVLADAVAEHRAAAARPTPSRAAPARTRSTNSAGCARRVSSSRSRRLGAGGDRAASRRSTPSSAARAARRSDRPPSRKTGSVAYSSRAHADVLAPWPGNRNATGRAPPSCVPSPPARARAASDARPRRRRRCDDDARGGAETPAARPAACRPRRRASVAAFASRMLGEVSVPAVERARRSRRQHQQTCDAAASPTTPAAAPPRARRARWCRRCRTS